MPDIRVIPSPCLFDYFEVGVARRQVDSACLSSQVKAPIGVLEVEGENLAPLGSGAVRWIYSAEVQALHQPPLP